ncbi:SAF domain-containing protein [Rhodovibrio sodomensis]|nr:SAF domain-containing protein [Rhodovibrio sodomensis]
MIGAIVFVIAGLTWGPKLLPQEGVLQPTPQKVEPTPQVEPEAPTVRVLVMMRQKQAGEAIDPVRDVTVVERPLDNVDPSAITSTGFLEDHRAYAQVAERILRVSLMAGQTLSPNMLREPKVEERRPQTPEEAARQRAITYFDKKAEIAADPEMALFTPAEVQHALAAESDQVTVFVEESLEGMIKRTPVKQDVTLQQVRFQAADCREVTYYANVGRDTADLLHVLRLRVAAPAIRIRPATKEDARDGSRICAGGDNTCYYLDTVGKSDNTVKPTPFTEQEAEIDPATGLPRVRTSEDMSTWCKDGALRDPRIVDTKAESAQRQATPWAGNQQPADAWQPIDDGRSMPEMPPMPDVPNPDMPAGGETLPPPPAFEGE